MAGEKYLGAEDNATGTGPNANSGNPPASTGAGTDSGCVSVARSASPPGTSSDGTDRIGFEYDAFGLDAVSWTSSSLRAPATLTQAQLLGIYNCTFTDWRQVGGAPGSIQRYLPPAGSETRLFFATDILNQSATYMPPTGVAGCPDPVVIDENEGQQVRATDSDSVIMPYAASAWDLQQSNSLNPSLDRRVNSVGAVQLLHGITTAAPAPGAPLIASPVRWNSSNHDYELDTAGPVVESNVRVNLAAGATPAYPGIRYVYNVLDRNVTTNSAYAAAESLFGFDNSAPSATTKSPMCSNQGPSSNQVLAVNAIWSGGFASLSTMGSINGNNRAGATCRQFLVTS
ncbi:MAG TPA: substrate-binding domain-containing protein [Acidimicrobiales bacterium]|nr:substrate-binding domain-containing protein [Acidimicrobiales bacterium]